MKTKSLLLCTLALFCAMASSAADPSVENVALTWDPDLRRATVVYDLKAADAVITADVCTNGASIGGERQWKVYGDVNRLVPVGDGKSFVWQAANDFEIVSASQMGVTLQVWAVTNPPPYLAVDVTVQNFHRYYASEAFVPRGPTNDMYRLDKILLRKMPAAGLAWVIGSPANEAGREPDGREQQRRVMLSADYYIGVHEITQHQVAMLGGGRGVGFGITSPPMPSNGLNTKRLRGDALLWPANGHSVGSSSIIGVLRTVSGISSFDLPTSAQWEYAARAGSSSRYYWGDDNSSDTVGQYEWFYGNTGDGRMRMGGLLKPNPWGLYDILGNNPELALDWYSKPAASETVIVDPRGPETEDPDYPSCKVLRGGKFEYNANMCRCAFISRQTSLNYDGVAMCRLVCDAVAQ